MNNCINLMNDQLSKISYSEFKSYTIVLKAHADQDFRGDSIEQIYWHTQTGEVVLVMVNGIFITSAFGQEPFFCVEIEDQRFEFDTYREAAEFAMETIWA